MDCTINLLIYLLTEVCFLIYETQANNSHEAASILVGNLVKSETPGWYQIFLKALVEKGEKSIIPYCKII